jgi:hypothetical protein
MPVGRASNRNADFRSQLNNAWVNSPVMSRDHAEISADFNTTRVYIKDMGSMHGTFVSGEKLPIKVPRVIKAGDHITFGAPVRNQPSDIIQPIRFQVAIEFGKPAFVARKTITLGFANPISSSESTASAKGPNVFQVPDDSSSESDDDIEFSRQILINKCGVKAMLSSSPSRTHVVDLTADDDMDTGEPSKSPQKDVVELEQPIDVDTDPRQEHLEGGDGPEDVEIDDDVEIIRLSYGKFYGSGDEDSLCEEQEVSMSEEDETSALDFDEASAPEYDDYPSTDEQYDEMSASEMSVDEQVDEPETQLASLQEALAGVQENTPPRLPPIRWNAPASGPICPPSSGTTVFGDSRDRAEFFAAREANKQTVMAQQAADKEREQVSESSAPATDLRQNDIVAEDAAWARSGDEFLNSPVDGLAEVVDDSRDNCHKLDDTSAYQFFLSKLKAGESLKAAEAAATPKVTLITEVAVATEATAAADVAEATAIVEDTHNDSDMALVPITPTSEAAHETQEDPQDSLLPSTPTTGKKRKAEEMLAEPSTPETANIIPTPDSSPVAITPRDEDHQPPKRLRKMASVVGLTTIGGVAGGLAIFASLIATAPSFS